MFYPVQSINADELLKYLHRGLNYYFSLEGLYFVDKI